MTNPPPGVGSLLLEALSERLLRHDDVKLWRAIFLDPAHAGVEFETLRYTVLASDSPLDGISDEEGSLLAGRLGAEAQPATTSDLLLSFRSPTAAVRAALVLQRLSAGRSVRTAVTSVAGTVATVEIDGQVRRILVGPGIERAELALTESVPGTILVCGETYNALGDTISEHLRDGLVMTELDDETVTCASITLPPHAAAEASTFAGLGRF
jgi:hypothetical protein